MAAITFNAVHQTERPRERLRIALAALRGMLDTFVSYRMRLAADAADHARPREVQRPSKCVQ